MITEASYWAVVVVAAVVYWLLPRGRVGFLAAVSFAYLLTGDAFSVLVLAGWAGAFYLLAPRVRAGGPGARALSWALVLGIVGYLAYFKYVPPLLASFAAEGRPHDLILPLGISYFTFKLVHYAVEVGRGNIRPHPVSEFLLYIFLFPIFSAGPIERFDNFLKNREERITAQGVAEGLTRILHGLIKKFVIAEALIVPLLADPPAERLAMNLQDFNPLRIWYHLGFFFLFAYLDFSAYTDIAVGTSRLFGFRIIENFNFPIVARNMVDFWARWHISLSLWARTYVYMPLIGITRNPYAASYAAFAMIGLWHEGSLNWLFWGLYHATGVSICQTWLRYKRRRKWKAIDQYRYWPIGWAITMAFVTGSYAFAATSPHGGLWLGLRFLFKLFWIDLPESPF